LQGFWMSHLSGTLCSITALVLTGLNQNQFFQ
jgi:hypothetical protein